MEHETRSVGKFPEPTMVSVNGVELEVFEAGRENRGRPIVLCHGWPELAYSWRHQLPALAAAGYHVIAPNQRGYGRSSRPTEVTDYDLEHLTGDLVALLDHFGYQKATFVGHDWGATVVWGLAQLHPHRLDALVALSVPYVERGPTPWVEFLEGLLGGDSHLVHFNRHPGVADAVFEANTERFLGNLFRTNVSPGELPVGMVFIQLALADWAPGESVMSDQDLAVYVSGFRSSGFTSSVNWYRNLDRNWHGLGRVDPVVRQPALMVYGDHDPFAAPSRNLDEFVPQVEVIHLDCGHWIPHERPDEVNRIVLDWLRRQGR